MNFTKLISRDRSLLLGWLATAKHSQTNSRPTCEDQLSDDSIIYLPPHIKSRSTSCTFSPLDFTTSSITRVPHPTENTSTTNMRFSDLSIVLIAMAGPAHAQWKDNPALFLEDVRPGHTEDISALPKAIVSLPIAPPHLYPPLKPPLTKHSTTTATLRLELSPHTMDTRGKTARPLLRLVGRKMAPRTTSLYPQG
jgi:hypothetical protein